MQLRKTQLSFFSGEQLGRALSIYFTTLGVNFFIRSFFQPVIASTMNVSQTSPTSEFSVNTVPGGYDPCIAGLMGGGFVIVWTPGPGSLRADLRAKLFDSSANALTGDFNVVADSTYTKWDPDIASLNDKGFIITWTSSAMYGSGQDGNGSGVFARRYDYLANPLTSTEFLVNTYTFNNQYFAAVTHLLDGGYVITWDSYGQDGDTGGIFAQQYDVFGNKTTSEFQVNTNTLGDQSQPDVAVLNNGDYIISWVTLINYVGYGIRQQHYYSNGNRFGGELNVSALTGSQVLGPEISSISNNSYIIVWTGYDTQNVGILAQRFDYLSQPIGTTFIVNTYLSNYQDMPAVATLKDGTFLVVWEKAIQGTSYYDITAKHFDAMTTQLGSEFSVNDFFNFTQSYPSVSGLIDGGFVVAWTSNGPPYGNYNIYAKLYGIPQFFAYSFNITEGQLLLIDNSMLYANSTFATADQIVITVSNVSNGKFVMVGISNSNLTSFTQAQINNKTIGFLQDGSKLMPSFNFQAAVGGMLSSVVDASITFALVDYPPVIVVNRLSLNGGSIVVLTSFDLQATDIETPSANLMFYISNISHCKIELVNTNQIVMNFLQQEIMSGNIQLVHDGSLFAPSYWVSVSDGTSIVGPELANITFTPGNVTASPMPVQPINSSLSTEIGASVAAGVVALGLLGVGGFWFRKRTQDANTRAQHPFADYIRAELNLKGLDNFDSDKGKRYVSVIYKLVTEFSTQGGMSVSNMSDDELKKLAKQVAVSARNKITSSTTLKYSIIKLEDIDQKNSAIVLDVLRMRVGQNDSHIPMSSL